MPELDPAQVRRITDAVLERPEYSDAAPSLLDRLIRLGLDTLARLLEALASGGRGSILGGLILAGAALGVVALVAGLLRRTRRDPSGRPGSVESAGRSARDWSRLAEEYERSEHWRKALRCRYRALVAELAAAGLLDEVPGRTAREYLVAIRADHPDAAEPFARATSAFEAAWYTRRAVTRADVRAVRQSADQVLGRTSLARVS